MIPVSGVVLLVIVGCRDCDWLHMLWFFTDSTRVTAVPQLKIPDAG